MVQRYVFILFKKVLVFFYFFYFEERLFCDFSKLQTTVEKFRRKNLRKTIFHSFIIILVYKFVSKDKDRNI